MKAFWWLIPWRMLFILYSPLGMYWAATNGAPHIWWKLAAWTIIGGGNALLFWWDLERYLDHRMAWKIEGYEVGLFGPKEEKVWDAEKGKMISRKVVRRWWQNREYWRDAPW